MADLKTIGKVALGLAAPALGTGMLLYEGGKKIANSLFDKNPKEIREHYGEKISKGRTIALVTKEGTYKVEDVNKNGKIDAKDRFTLACGE